MASACVSISWLTSVIVHRAEDYIDVPCRISLRTVLSKLRTSCLAVSCSALTECLFPVITISCNNGHQSCKDIISLSDMNKIEISLRIKVLAIVQ